MSAGPNKTIKNRLLFLVVAIFLVGFVPLCVNLFDIQVVNYEYYQQKAIKQQTSDKLITPKRGTIYDRNLKPLAESASVETVYLSPLDIKKNKEDADLIATRLAEILGQDREKIYNMTQKTNSQYEVVNKYVEKPQADEIRAFIKENKIKSIDFAESSKRYYPYGNFAAHILGFVGTDNQGLAGIEALYDEELSGSAGRIITEKTPIGEMPYTYEKYVDAENGLGVVLTIDEVMQHFLEKSLEEALVEYELGKKATGIVMNVKTGEILAMAMKGDFDPNNPFDITDQAILDQMAADPDNASKIRKEYLESVLWRNNAIADAYEPGSVFKMITASMALEEKIVTPTTPFTCNGYLQVGKWKIDCWKTVGHGAETFFEGIANSCNPVFMKTAAMMGRNIFYKYQVAFGFKDKTGIDLPGEGTSILHSLDDLNDAELATSAFGQTFKVTPIQMITAISAVANGGTLYEPHVVKQLVDENGTVVKNIEPVAKRQVISAETSALMCDALERTATTGTGKNAYIPGYRMAGKTGTSEKVDVKDEFGQTDRTKRIASFGCFAPANDPQIACLIILDEPKNYKLGGGAIAAPTAKNVMADCLKYLGVEPQYTEKELAELDIEVPNVIGATPAAAKNTLQGENLKATVVGSGETVLAQFPKAGARTPADTSIYLITEEGVRATTVTVPDVMGMTPQQANQAIVNAGLNMKINGNKTGSNLTVRSQSLSAGTTAQLGDVMEISLADTVDVGE